MLSLYNPQTGTTVNTNGVDGVSDNMLGINILIELRVISALLHGMQSGVVFIPLSQLRNDAVNATVNPPK